MSLSSWQLTVHCDAVRTNHNGINLSLCHERRRSRVAQKSRWHLLVHHLIGSEA